MVFAVGKDGPNIVLLDAQQSAANKGVRVALTASDKSGSSLSLFGENGTTPVASVRAKPGAGAASASGVFVAVNDENRPVAFPRSAKSVEGDDAAKE
jgi:hypothetical protein